jgi:hypothetical protein
MARPRVQKTEAEKMTSVKGGARNGRSKTDGSGRISPAADLHERIAELAYTFYEQRGGQPGSPIDDWLAAERQILSEASLKTD